MYCPANRAGILQDRWFELILEQKAQETTPIIAPLDWAQGRLHQQKWHWNHTRKFLARHFYNHIVSILVLLLENTMGPPASTWERTNEGEVSKNFLSIEIIKENSE
jgi:hypothetical protein